LGVALYDTLSHESTIPRNRTLVSIVQMGARLLEVAEIEDRVLALEEALQSRAEMYGGR
jgi:hypothetical protein